jgi:hypothetical protein
MIHYKKEGHALEIGLNITVGVNKKVLPWITLCWAWYTPRTNRMSGWRIRIRTWKFAVFTSRSDWDVIENYLRTTDQRLITRELIEDIRLHAYINGNVTLDALLDRYSLPKNKGWDFEE